MQKVVGTKFQIKLTVLNFGPNLAKKGIQKEKLKIENVNITTKYCIFELAWVPNFSLD